MKAVRYIKVDGDPKHWDLATCLAEYFGGNNPPERANLAFLLGLRNKIEHRHLPHLDASLYGECQAALMNLEEMLVQEFDNRYALTEQLAVSLQFSQLIPEEKRSASRKFASRAATSVTDYTERFRGNLPVAVLNSMKYSFNVFLVPKVVNRQNAADAAVQFVTVDEANSDELERLDKLNVLIKEKHIQVANLHLLRPKQVVQDVSAKRPGLRFTMGMHTESWKELNVRPTSDSKTPEKTDSKYCVYDRAHRDYLYTPAWVKLLVKRLDDAAQAAAKPNSP